MVGDVIEIPTPKGLAYAQYTHRHDLYGELIRILPGLYDRRPESFAELVRSKELYFVFFTLAAAVSKGVVEIAAQESVPRAAVEFPLMRRRGAITPDGKVLNWWLWNGETEWRVDELNEEQESLSIRGVWNAALLVERIVEGWTPKENLAVGAKVSSEDQSSIHSTSSVLEVSPDTKPGDLTVLRELRRAGVDFSVPHRVLHYLYFPLKKSARQAAEELKKAGFKVDVSRADDDESWLALASQPALLTPEAVCALRSQLEEIACNLDGEYDGWEAEVAPSTLI